MGHSGLGGIGHVAEIHPKINPPFFGKETHPTSEKVSITGQPQTTQWLLGGGEELTFCFIEA